MNWLLNHYFAEGPGISKDAPKATGLRLLGQILAREWWGLIKLNLLFIAASLPLVTFPAAYVAMTKITVSMVEDRNYYLWRDFREAFLRQFWTATLTGTALAAVFALGWFACTSYAQAAANWLGFSLPLAIGAVVTLMVPIIGAHLFVLITKERSTPVGILIRAAIIGTVIRPLPGLAALAVMGPLWLAHILFYPASVFLPVLVNFALGALLLTFAVHRGATLGLERIQSSGRAHHNQDQAGMNRPAQS